MRWAIREAAGRIDRIWVLSSTHSVQLAMNTAVEVSTPRPVTFDGGDGNDWGVNWPSIEDAARGLILFLRSSASQVREDFPFRLLACLASK